MNSIYVQLSSLTSPLLPCRWPTPESHKKISNPWVRNMTDSTGETSLFSRYMGREGERFTPQLLSCEKATNCWPSFLLPPTVPLSLVSNPNPLPPIQYPSYTRGCKVQETWLVLQRLSCSGRPGTAAISTPLNLPSPTSTLERMEQNVSSNHIEDSTAIIDPIANEVIPPGESFLSQHAEPTLNFSFSPTKRCPPATARVLNP